MAYPIVGSNGAATSWGLSGFYATLLAGISPNSARIEIVADDHDVTSLNATTQQTIIGLRTVTGSISARAFATPRLGNVGLVSFGTNYTTHVQSFDLTIETVAVHDWTRFVAPATPPTWRKFRPDRIRWYCSYTALVDNTTDLSFPTAPAAASSSLTLTYGDDATDDDVTGSAFSRRVGFGFTEGDMQTAEYEAIGTGDLTPRGSASIFGSSVFGVPLWSEGGATTNTLLTLTAISGQTYTVDAFYRSINLRCAVGEPITIEIQWQGIDAVAGTGIA